MSQLDLYEPAQLAALRNRIAYARRLAYRGAAQLHASAKLHNEHGHTAFAAHFARIAEELTAELDSL